MTTKIVIAALIFAALFTGKMDFEEQKTRVERDITPAELCLRKQVWM